ncbi:MAG: type II toxin-antitoxin system HipA family toxin [Acidobacteriota bacterium]
MKTEDGFRLDVRLDKTTTESRPVGQLLETRGRLFFEYAPEFLANPIWLSPFKLPPKPGAIEHRDRQFGPIFGLFDESLPDGWGLLLMDRYFQQLGRRPRDIGVLERLAYLGSRTMGALTYHPPKEAARRDPDLLELAALAEASGEVLRGDTQVVLPQLLRAGGSPGGARPKVLVGIRGDEIYSGEGDLPLDFEPWIIKFRGLNDPRDAGALELAYARLAERAGLRMPETRLFSDKDGERYFGIRRFDRRDGRRRHVQTFGNLIHANFRVPSCDYSQLLDVTRRLTQRQEDGAECFRRMIFNVATHNRDDHVKNFAFLIDDQGQWRLTPAYDLTFADGPGGEHSTTVAGEGRNPGRRDALKLAAAAGLSTRAAKEIIDEVVESVGELDALARELDVDAEVRREVRRGTEACRARLAGS